MNRIKKAFENKKAFIPFITEHEERSEKILTILQDYDIV